MAGAAVWRATADTAQVSAARVLPDGCMDLIWADDALMVAGPDTTAHLTAWRPGRDYVGLRFAPGTGPTILGVAAHELRDQRVGLAHLWPAGRVRRLTEHVAAAPRRGVALEEIAFGRLRRVEPPDPAILAAVDRLRAGATVAATAAAVGMGERHLYRRCLAALGYGPKTLARILRMNRALAMSRAGIPPATVAAEAGYADQPHLAREVRSLTGVPLSVLTP
ncbi:helix-turn-helix domain-containing protein [Salinactinospora qingdaonensis]|uniref:Helix-turn-helix transcriptional regulator n=1 Tax=Salinactinospora qingdaonensis TaxID=702744 RepID=A0ABP7FFM7_9ACTN